MYKLQNIHVMREGDKGKSLELAGYCLSYPHGYSQILSKLVFHECLFRVNRVVEKQNMRYRNTECSEVYILVLVNSPLFMVWCTISEEHLKSPYFSSCKCSCESYRNLLIPYVLQRFQYLEKNYVSQQNGAPRQYSNRVRHYLSNMRPNNWTRRGTLVGWPPRSPDLAQCD